MRPVNISMGIIAHNEEENIQMLLEIICAQKFNAFVLSEIYVVSSGSTDGTNDIVKLVAEKDDRIILILEEKRTGKYNAVNLFLEQAKSDVLVLESADTIPRDGAIEKLCIPLLDKDVGIVASHPIPRNEPHSLASYAFDLQWRILHDISSMIRPKYGELIAFKNCFSQLPPTVVDEEEIAQLILSQGYTGKYVADAVVYNNSPKTLKAYIHQRRRIFAGHAYLKKQKGYKVPTYSVVTLLYFFMKQLCLKAFHRNIFVAIIEVYSRILGTYDNAFFPQKHYIWRRSPNSKQETSMNYRRRA